MKKIPILILSIILLAVTTAYPDDSPVLKLDTGGHMALIRKIIPMNDGRHIVSASDDKTIRIWDATTGRETAKILGQIGSGSDGKIFTIALSPDERWLAVGGYLDKELDYRHAIRIYDLKTGGLTRVLRSHKNVVNDLAISPDGRYLVSGSTDKTVKIWDAGNGFELVRTLEGHTAQVYAVRIFRHGGWRIVSAGYDNKAILWSLDNGREIRSYTHSNGLDSLAVSSDYIAAAPAQGDNKIIVFDHDLKKIREITSETNPQGLAFSPNGGLLLAGAGANPNVCNVYDVRDNFREITSFKRHYNLTMAVAFLDDSTAVTGGGANKDIYLWDAHNGDIKRHIAGHGNTVWSVGINGREIGFGSIGMRYTNEQTNLEKSFNLDTYIVGKATGGFKRIDTSYHGYSLGHERGGGYGYEDAVLVIRRDGEVVKRIVRDATNGYGHNTYGFTDGGVIISGGSNGFLTAYDTSGNILASFTGHTGEVWSVATDKDLLVSGSSDQTIKLWDLKELKAGKTVIYPIASIFAADDGNWVVWTEEGFFNASKDGAKYIGYHINKGPERAAEFVPVDKLYASFYRPDLVEARLAGRDISEYSQRINIGNLLKGGLPPRVELLTQPGTSKTKDIKLKARIYDKGDGVGNITIFLNGIPVSIEGAGRSVEIKGREAQGANYIDFERLISLQAGTNRIGLMAYNRGNTIESNRPEVELVYKSAVVTRPDLHIMAIAINQYRDGDLRLKYSINDADGLIETIRQRSGPLFKNIHVYKVYDADATRAGIKKKFGEIKADTEDVFILFVAGHGITYNKDGSYYFIPVDFRYTSSDEIPRQGVSMDNFKEFLTNVKAQKSLLLLDTCNSGSFAEAIGSRGMLEKTAIDKLSRAVGRSTIVASSKDQVAMEGFEGHGVFTYTALKALNAFKSYRNNHLTVNDLATYIEEKLPELTLKKWGYEQIPQKTLTGMDFPIAQGGN